ncbi:helix-turn-helix domain-containing protein [Caulobacter sp. NIBR2454]|uniref:helix-turn-helix domain-containing protein n=1 Tax=Caulobacter sp. NIBR2454 TaxID=3015996 RepID=UPI0022B6E0BB|nr:AraC family transcriptional regulator [Caulobacter sp. NIBR2454]
MSAEAVPGLILGSLDGVPPRTEQILSATLGDYEAENLTPPGVESFELSFVKGAAGERRTAVWPTFSLVRNAGALRISDFRCDGQRFRGALKDGGVATFATGSFMEIEWASRPTYHLLTFASEDVEDALARLGVGRRPQLRSRLQVGDAVLEGLYANFVEEAERGWPKGAVFAEWFALSILMRTAEICTDAEGSAIDRARGLAPRQLARALELIDQGIDQNLTLSDLASAVGLSRFHFARRFRQSTGVSPVKHLINRRLDRAFQLLRTGTRSVMEVALACGYENTSHFTRAFRTRFGMTPSDCVRQHSR